MKKIIILLVVLISTILNAQDNKSLSGFQSPNNAIIAKYFLYDGSGFNKGGVGLSWSPMPYGYFVNAVIRNLEVNSLAVADLKNTESYNYFIDTSIVNDTYGFVTSDIIEYNDGMEITFKAGVANDGGCNLRINGLGARAIKTPGNDDPPANYIEVGSRVKVIFCDEATDRWQLLSPDANP